MTSYTSLQTRPLGIVGAYSYYHESYICLFLSFSMRLRVDDDSDLLKTTSVVELQKLKVVPQTVFLKVRAPDTPSRGSRVSSSSKRLTVDPMRSWAPDTPRISRPPSVDQGSTGAPFEDLRRRLSAFNGSGASVPSRPPSLAPLSPRAVTSPTVSELPPTIDRPGSPTESVFSTTASVRPLRMHMGGSADSQKAAPAVGSSRTNATGLLEATARMRSDGSPERSERTSPVSIAGTIRGYQGKRSSPLPISTYGQSVPARCITFVN